MVTPPRCRLAIFILLLLAGLQPLAQAPPLTLQGKVREKAGGLPVAHAVVELLRAGDTAVLQVTLSDSTGAFRFTGVPQAAVVLRFTHTGFAARTEAVTLGPGSANTPVVAELEPRPTALREVVVTSRKPVISFQGDKLIVDPQNLAGATGANALQVLKYIPGVMVENEESILLNGRSEVIVLIDDRKRTLTPEQAIRLLQSIPASHIRQIEITSGKSARYDAAGSAGIINIVTRKPLGNGYNMELTNRAVADRYLSHGHNVYLNWKRQALSLYTSAGWERNHGYHSALAQSAYKKYNGRTETRDHTTTHTATATPYADLGLDYALNDRHVLGLAASYYGGTTRGTSLLQTELHGADVLHIANRTRLDNPDNLFTADLVYTGKLDSLGTKLKVDVGYLGGRSLSRPGFQTVYTNAAGTKLFAPIDVTASLPLRGHQYVGQADFEKPLKREGLLQAGLKFTDGTVGNQVSYDTVRNGALYRDPRRSDNLRYEESVAAAYLTYRFRISKTLNAIVGARYEHTRMTSISIIGDSAFSRAYQGIFPNASVSYNGKKISSSLNFGRSIARPYYGYLNPYERYIDPFSYQVGNSLLAPGYSYSLNWSNAIADLVYVNMGVTQSRDFVMLLRRQVPDTTLTVIRPENALNYNLAYASVSSNFSLLDGKWTGQLSLYGFIYQASVHPKFFTSTLDARTLGRYSISSSHTVRLPKAWSVETGFYYYGRNRTNQQETGARWQADAGFRKKIPGRGLTVALYTMDLFRTMGLEMNRYYDGFSSYSHYRYNTRRVRLSVVLSLGKLEQDFSKSGSAKKEATRFRDN